MWNKGKVEGTVGCERKRDLDSRVVERRVDDGMGVRPPVLFCVFFLR